MPNVDKNALVISGGTAKGAYAAGLLHGLFTRFPAVADCVQIVSGTSTGSLIAPMLSLYILDPVKNRYLLDLMVHGYEVASTAVFVDEPRKLRWRLVERLLRPFMNRTEARILAMLGETGAALDTSPLAAIVAAEYTDARLDELRDGRDRIQCLVNCVSAQTGGVVVFSSADPAVTAPVLRDAIYASCLQPIFMPLKTINWPPDGPQPQDYMDGGVRDVVPAYSAWSAGATRLLLVTLFRESDAVAGDSFVGRGNLLRLLQRVVVGLLNDEVQDDDVLQARYLATIGRLVAWANAQGATGQELDTLLEALLDKEKARFSGPSFLDRLLVHRPPAHVPLVESFQWNAEQMVASIAAGREVAAGAEGQLMHDFLVGAGSPRSQLARPAVA